MSEWTLLFYDQFKKRISSGLSQDTQHQVYLKLKNSPKNGINPKPLPSIFSVQSASDPSSRIEIKSFVNAIRRTADGVEISYGYFKPCVYLVKISIGTTEMDAVLKISYNYDIEAHKKLNEHGFAPTIIGYEKMFGRWHVMLMEYFDNTTYDSLFSHVRESKNKEIKLDCKTITRSLEEMLGKLEELQLVHGDFRSSNILAKRSATNPAVLEDFKLVDFELSGKVNENYPFLALRNREVDWHKDVNSYTPRQFSHDRHLFMDMCAKELEISRLNKIEDDLRLVSFTHKLMFRITDNYLDKILFQ
jgi:predicted Ser/Thr protein kinase